MNKPQPLLLLLAAMLVQETTQNWSPLLHLFLLQLVITSAVLQPPCNREEQD